VEYEVSIMGEGKYSAIHPESIRPVPSIGLRPSRLKCAASRSVFETSLTYLILI
jgi:hypothetical protein